MRSRVIQVAVTSTCWILLVSRRFQSVVGFLGPIASKTRWNRYVESSHRLYAESSATLKTPKEKKENPTTEPIQKTQKKGSTSKRSAIVTGPNGKPAASKEEDLRLTLQILREFHGLLEEDIDTTADDSVSLVVEQDATLAETTAATDTKGSASSTLVVEKEKDLTETTPGKVGTDELGLDSEDSASPVVVEEGIVEIDFDTIKDKLSMPTYSAGPLKRIASGLGPSVGQALPHDPNKIESISVINLDATQIELAALVCEGGDCINIAIPISFPKSCSEQQQTHTHQQSTMEECILANIQQLDAQATAIIQQAQVAEDSYEQIQSDQRLRAELEDDSIRSILPDWWTEPVGVGDFTMQDECSSVKQLLNDEEFQPEILALAKQHYKKNTITHAAVALVGTSGLLLRGNVLYTDEDGDTQNMIVDVPVPFPSGEANTATAHRLAILDLVDGA